MKKTSSQTKSIQKGKSVSSIQPYQESRVTNRSNDPHKIDSKVSKTSKTNSVVRLHQPLTIQHRTIHKDSNRASSRVQTAELPQSRKKIQSHLENKNSYQAQNPVSFRQTETKGGSVRTRETKASGERQRVESRVYQVNENIEKENKELKEKLVRMQESALEDKEKIKALITRISEMKRDQKASEQSSMALMSKSKTTASYANIIKSRFPSDREAGQSSHQKVAESPFRILQPSASQYSRNKEICGNPLCEERRRNLEGELYRERIKRDELEEEKREWERNKEVLKRQYAEMLGEIQELRNEAGVGYDER